MFGDGPGTSAQASQVINIMGGIKTMANKKGIFCLETAKWEEEVKDQDSYDHFLRFLETSRIDTGGIPYRHFDVATKEEFKFYLKNWKEQKIQRHFPVLLLAFHGDKKGLSVIKNQVRISADEIVKDLYDCEYDNAIIHFSSCYFVKDTKMKELLYNSGALSVSGYMNEEGVGWYTAMAFELLYLTELFRAGLPKTSLEMQNFVDSYFATNKEMKDLGESLRFNMWYRVDNSKADE